MSKSSIRVVSENNPDEAIAPVTVGNPLAAADLVIDQSHMEEFATAEEGSASLEAAATRLGFTWTAFGAITRPSFARDANGEWVRKCRCGGELVLFKRDGNVRVGEWDAGPTCSAIEREAVFQWLCDQGYYFAHLDKHIIRLTLFDYVAARTKRSYDRTLPQIRDMILRRTAQTEAQLPLLKLARFGSIRSEGGSLRHNANLQTISGIELDCDRGDVSFDAAKAKFKDLDCIALLYTSPSHTEQRPRWRLLLPTSRELDPDMRHVLAKRVNGYFGEIFDPAAFTPSQAFSFGRALDNPNHELRIAWGGDEFIDLHRDPAPSVGWGPP